MQSNAKQVLIWTGASEGGYVNDPDDPGWYSGRHSQDTLSRQECMIAKNTLLCFLVGNRHCCSA